MININEIEAVNIGSYDPIASDFEDIKQKKVMFQNGFGASIITGGYSEKGHPYELAVIDENGLRYDTPITDNVIGWLNKSEVMEILIKISKLPPIVKQLEKA